MKDGSIKLAVLMATLYVSGPVVGETIGLPETELFRPLIADPEKRLRTTGPDLKPGDAFRMR